MSGLEPHGRAQALEAVLSPAANIFVGLLDTMPVNGFGAIEISPAGYARISAANWTTTTIAGASEVTTRCNADNLAMGPYATEVNARGWALYDAITNGNLVASGPFVDAGFGQAGILNIPALDDIQFQPGDLCVTITSSCPVMVAPDVCPVPVYAQYVDQSFNVIVVPIGGPPPSEGAGNGSNSGSIITDIAFNGADYTAEYFFDAVSQGPLTAFPFGPGPHTSWEFQWFAQPPVGQVVSVTVTKNSDPACTFSIDFAVSV